ncbi:MAG: hypothetical protein ABR511_11200 [Acidimicrobiales bacterium]
MASAVEPAVAAINDGRQLLDQPDPVSPLLVELTTALRGQLTTQAQQLAAAQRDAVAELEAWEGWSQLDSSNRQAIVADATLDPIEPPDVSTDAALLQVLDTTPLTGWQDRISLVPSRRDHARQGAAKLLEPESVTVALPPATIKTTEDLQAYLDDLRSRVQSHLDEDKTVII